MKTVEEALQSPHCVLRTEVNRKAARNAPPNTEVTSKHIRQQNANAIGWLLPQKLHL